MSQFSDTVRRGRHLVTTHYVYRGNPGCPEIVAVCTTKEAATAARCLLNSASRVERGRTNDDEQ